jgi:hypothetical protein
MPVLLQTGPLTPRRPPSNENKTGRKKMRSWWSFENVLTNCTPRMSPPPANTRRRSRSRPTTPFSAITRKVGRHECQVIWSPPVWGRGLEPIPEQATCKRTGVDRKHAETACTTRFSPTPVGMVLEGTLRQRALHTLGRRSQRPRGRRGWRVTRSCKGSVRQREGTPRL